MNDEKWTSEFPTTPGFYWVRNLEYKHWPGAPLVSQPDAQVVRIYDNFDIGFTGDEVTLQEGQIKSAEWQGPIEPNGK